jgi:hypothetical protein
VAKSAKYRLKKVLRFLKWLKSMGGQSLLCGPSRWRAKAILIDSRHLTGDCGHGICGTGMIVTNVSVMSDRSNSSPNNRAHSDP